VKAFEGKRVTVEVDDGNEIVRVAPAVAIVAVDAEDRVVLVKQHRPAVGKELLEIPAGLLEPDEEPLAAARRELREETGLHGGDWLDAGAIVTSPGFTDERVHLFIARGLEEGEDDQDAGEQIELQRVPRREVLGLLAEVEDAKTRIGLDALLRDRRPPPGEDIGPVTAFLTATFVALLFLVGVLLLVVFDLLVVLPIAVVRALLGKESWGRVRRTPGFFLAALVGGVGATFLGVRNAFRD
jgi:ADP-ribose pyrophosphatase